MSMKDGVYDREWFVDFIGAAQASALDLIRRKNADYAGSADPFLNFKLSEHLGIPAEKAIVVRMGDKLQRIANLLEREAQVKDESVDDTLKDLANYSLILLAYLVSKRAPKKDKPIRL